MLLPAKMLTRACACPLGVFVLLSAAPVFAADETTLFSPPAPAGAAPANTADADLGSLQLSGISTLGGQSMFNFVDARNNRSFWIALNGSANGFSVVSYDETSDTVVVSRNGQQRSVKLRQAKIASMPGPVPQAAPAVVQAPAMPAGGPPPAVIKTPDGGEIVNPKTPQEIAQAEMEARMMVSDLLEFSMQERARQKALREAQRQQQQQSGGQPRANTP